MNKKTYKIKWHKSAWFTYYDASSGKELGKWDVFQITKKGNSQMPRQFIQVVRDCIIASREEYGRKVKAVRLALCKAGEKCGFEPVLEGKIVYWIVLYHGKRKWVMALDTLHCRWRKERKLTKRVCTSKAFLRFVVDNNNNKVGVWSMPKLEL